MSSFEETMMSRNPQCYIPSFVKFGPLVPEKIFEEFLLYGRGGHLGQMTSIISTNFHFLGPESLHPKWPRFFLEKPVLFFICK